MTSDLKVLNRPTVNFEASKIIGLISDTHIPRRAACIPSRVYEVFKNVDFIIHAGDLVELSVIDELEQIAPVLAVHGNMDVPEVYNCLPVLDSMKIFDWKIGVKHDPNILQGTEEMVQTAKQYSFNVFVYGHTHSSRVKWEEKTLYINPGSPTDPGSLLNKPSVGLLKITKDAIIPQIMEL
jgi:putative phosphoesterase